jgi:hypothetical protein
MAAGYLTGTIPSYLGNLLALEGVWLYDNLLSREIPADIDMLENLQNLGAATK